MVLFSANEGHGLFELTTPVDIPSKCWIDADEANPETCDDASATLTWIGASAETAYNDGMNCLDGGFLQPAPTRAPTAAPCDERACWSEAGVDAFDCDAHAQPVQVYRKDDGDHYTVAELDAVSGSYKDVYELDYFDGHVNAVALYDGGTDGYYAMASMGGQLCRFDGETNVCVGDLVLDKPNAAAILDQAYYYARSLGDGGDDERTIHVVKRIQEDSPTFVEGSSIEVSPSLFSGAIKDFSAVWEQDGAVYVDDNATDGRYLIGLAEDFTVLVVRVDDESLEPDAYATVPGVAVFPTGVEVDAVGSGFGASFAYYSDAGARLFFTANSGEGMFELELPITVPESCWNVDANWGDHVSCDVNATVMRIAESDVLSSNDGFNCPFGFILAPSPAPTATFAPSTLEPSYAPSGTPSYPPTTLEPTFMPAAPSPEPTFVPTSVMTVRWEDGSVESWDCEAHSLPVQILRQDSDNDYYSVVELDAETGTYVTLFDMEWFDGHCNAAAMHIGSQNIYDDDYATTYHAMAAFDGKLCRFDAEKKICFETALEYGSPNVGAILANNYYYGKSIGKNGGEAFYYVMDVHTDHPDFHDDYQFLVSGDVFEGSVLDVSAVLEVDDEIVQDGDSGRAYLVGLGGNYEVVVVRLDEQTGEPEAYAVVPSTVVGHNGTIVTTSFGASFSYRNQGETRLFFASNGGAGLFELQLPVEVPAGCWNDDENYQDHVACASGPAAEIVETTDAEVAASNDGLNCPLGGGAAINFAPAPTVSPAPTTSAPTTSPTAPSAIPTPTPSLEPTPHPSPSGCPAGEFLLAETYLPSASAFVDAGASETVSVDGSAVGSGASPTSDKAYSCVKEGSCYSYAWTFSGSAAGLTFGAALSGTKLRVELNGDGDFDYCVEGGVFVKYPTASPTTTPKPSSGPSATPTAEPFPRPTRRPTPAPTTPAPIPSPTPRPTTPIPSDAPSETPTTSSPTPGTPFPSSAPSFKPTNPTPSPTHPPTPAPIVSVAPTQTFAPTRQPTTSPKPTPAPSPTPTTANPTTATPSGIPSPEPTTSLPTYAPSEYARPRRNLPSRWTTRSPRKLPRRRRVDARDPARWMPAARRARSGRGGAATRLDGTPASPRLRAGIRRRSRRTAKSSRACSR